MYFFNELKANVEDFAGRKSVRFQNILDELYNKKDSKDTKNKASLEQISNKHQKEFKKKDLVKAFAPRNLFVGWRHRENFEADYQSMDSAIGSVIKITLNGNEDYTIDELKNIIITSYIKDENKYFFDNTLVSIGTFNGSLINKFVDNNEEECSFWEYCKCTLRPKYHSLKIYLLTTMLRASKYSTNNSRKSSSEELKCKEVLAVPKKKFKSTDSATASSTITSASNTKPNTSKISISNSKTTSVSASSKLEKKETKEMLFENFMQDEANFANLINEVNKGLGRPVERHELKDCSIPSPPFSAPQKENESYHSDIVDLTIENLSSSQSSSKDWHSKSNNSIQVHKEKKGLSSYDTNDSIPSPSFSKLTKVTSSPEVENIYLLTDNSKHTSLKTSNQKLVKDERKKDKENLNLITDASIFKTPKEVPKKKFSIPFINEGEIKFSNIIIGKGGQGIVLKGKYLGSYVAIKSITKGRHDKDIYKEISLLEKVRHPNIIHIMAVSATYTQIHIVMEYFESHSMSEIIFNPTVKEKFTLNILKKNRIAYQVCCAIAYLHLQKTPIIHRDIKPPNILVNKNCFTKLCDLGLGKCNNLDASLQSTVEGRFCGTLSFMPPEIFLEKKEATVNCDIWSLGCTFIELYSEKFIWDLSMPAIIYNKIQQLYINKQVPRTDEIPDNIRKEIDQCFQYNPIMRPKITVLSSLFESLPK